MTRLLLTWAFTLIAALAVSAMYGAEAAVPLADAMQPEAVRVAQQLGSSEIACSAAASELLAKATIEEPGATGWYEFPHKAKYTVRISGCGKQQTYSVACNNHKKSTGVCVAGPVVIQRSVAQLADKLEPGAVRVAQQYGSAELNCPAATAKVLTKETIQEVQGTGWYTPPRSAGYTVRVTGCGKETTYSVACEAKKGCVAGAVGVAKKMAKQLADRLEPGAVEVAQQRGSTDLDCPAARAKVLTRQTVQEPQSTGWYTPPRRASYTVSVMGCGKQAKYSVACDTREPSCKAVQ
jgi:hypothetical protein